MSKVDALRALREARYAAAARPAATAAPRPAAAPAPARKPAPATSRAASVVGSPAASVAEESVAEESVADSRCGHRSMNGRTCTRELGHPEKNHRYG